MLRQAADVVIPSATDTGAVRSRWWACVLIIFLALLAACGGRQSRREAALSRPGTEAMRVRDIRFVGVESVDEREIEEALATIEHTFNPFQGTHFFNRFELASDNDRIRAFYERHGFFDVRVVSTDVEELRAPNGRPGAVRVTFTVEEGEPSYVTRFVPQTDNMRQIDGETLIEGIDDPVGRRFDLGAIEQARDTMRERLQESSYAYARVDAVVYADRETRTVEVYVYFDPGPACLFGEIEVTGNRQIPDDLVVDRMNARVRTGNVYRHSKLRLAQLDLYDLDAFTFVSVEAQLDEGPRNQALREGTWSVDGVVHRVAMLDGMGEHIESMRARGYEPVIHVTDHQERDDVRVASLLDNLGEIRETDPEVPILVEVVESPGASYRVGGGIGIQSGRSETYTRGRATWRNVFAPLNRIDFETRLGYAWLPTLFTTERDIEGVIASAELGFTRAGAVFRLFDLSTSVGIERNLQDDYAFRKPSASIGLQRRFTEFTRGELSYTVDIVTVTTREELELTGTSCQAVPRQYRLTHADLVVTTDRRDNPLQGMDGFYTELGIQGGIDGPIGEFSYLRIQPDLRYYQPVTRGFSVAFRARAGTLIDFSGNVPRSQCLYLGGGDTVRGFAERRLSPFEDGVATGGLTSWLFSVEPRFEIGRDWLFGALFLDGGSVARDALDFNFGLGGEEGLHLGAGGGLRLITPIGPFRVDLGYRVTSGPSEFGGRLAFFLSLGEAF